MNNNKERSGPTAKLPVLASFGIGLHPAHSNHVCCLSGIMAMVPAQTPLHQQPSWAAMLPYRQGSVWAVAGRSEPAGLERESGLHTQTHAHSAPTPTMHFSHAGALQVANHSFSTSKPLAPCVWIQSSLWHSTWFFFNHKNDEVQFLPASSYLHPALTENTLKPDLEPPSPSACLLKHSKWSSALNLSSKPHFHFCTVMRALLYPNNLRELYFHLSLFSLSFLPYPHLLSHIWVADHFWDEYQDRGPQRTYLLKVGPPQL